MLFDQFCMKGKFVFIIFILIVLGLVYTRVSGDYSWYKVFKFSLAPSIALYYLVNSTSFKLSYKYLLVLFLTFLGDVVFTFDVKYLAFGFGSYCISNLAVSLLILCNMNLIKPAIFFKFIVVAIILLYVSAFFLYDNEAYKKVIIGLFYGSVVFVLLSAYYRNSKTLELYSLRMLLAALLFVFCNFIASLNYFVFNNPYYNAISSLTYCLFLFFMTQAILLEENKEFS